MLFREDLTVYYIVQNEDKWIRQSIRIAEDFLENILVVDTGSIDNTIDEVQKTGATLIQHGGIDRDKFGDIKNHYMNTIKTPLVLFVDGNEIVTPEGYRHIEYVVENLNWDKFPTFNLTEWEVLEIDKSRKDVTVTYLDWPRHRTRLCMKDQVVCRKRFGKSAISSKIETDIPDIGFRANKPEYLWHLRALGQSSKDVELPDRLHRNEENLKLVVPFHPKKKVKRDLEEFYRS